MKNIEVVCAVIFNENDEVFCCRRGPGRALEGFYEFPGGKVEKNETNEEAIIREIKEELNTIIKPVKYIGKVYQEYKDIDNPYSIVMYAYRCVIVKGELELREHTDKLWVKKDKLKEIKFAEADIQFIDML